MDAKADDGGKYLVQLRRELTRAQARLGRAERERDRLLDENRAMRRLLEAHGIDPPAELGADHGARRSPSR